MSELLRRLVAHIRSNPDPDVHVVARPDWPDDGPPTTASAAQLQISSAEPVEPLGTVVNVGGPKPGRLVYFMDGAQRTHTTCFFSMVPVVYGYTAAAIRRRGPDRLMRSLAHKSREALYVPYALLDRARFERAGLLTSDTGDPGKPAEEHPLMLLEAARTRISADRDRLEQQLTSEWLTDFAGGDEWLLVDGSLSGDYAKFDSPNVIGVIKSHQTQYFDWDTQRGVLSLSFGERSGVFIPGGRNRPEVYSWYLRLHSSEGRDVYFGLVRVELAKSKGSLEMVDEISRWLLAERSPVSLPDSRWDRMLYPIYDCEQFLRSLAPTKALIDACMVGLGA